jgi:SAM-dependent methyltransferase
LPFYAKAERLRQSLQDAKVMLHEDRVELKALRSEVARQNRLAANQSRLTANQKRQIDNLERAAADLKDRLRQAAQGSPEQRAELKALRRETARRSRLTANQERQIANLEKAVLDLKDRLVQARIGTPEERIQLKALRRETAKQNRLTANRERQIANKARQVTNLEGAVAELKDRLRQARATASEERVELKALRRETARQDRRTANQERQIANLEGAVVELKQASERLRALLRDHRTVLRSRDRQATDQKRQVRSLEKVVTELRDRGADAMPLPPPRLRTHVGRVDDMANYLGQGLDSARRVIEVFGQDPKGPVLDWGCGSGRTRRWLIGVGTWSDHYRGCDVDEEAIAWLRSQGVSGVEVCGDLPPLPYADQTFAGLYCFSVLTHIPPERHAAWYAEIHRVLKPGALAYVTVHGDHNMRSGKSFTDEERRAYSETGWSWSERDGHYKHAATVAKAFTLEALGGRFEVEAYRELGYHSMDDMILKKL